MFGMSGTLLDITEIMLLSITVYTIWRERNLRLFQNVQTDESLLLKQIQLNTYIRCLHYPKLSGLVP